MSREEGDLAVSKPDEDERLEGDSADHLWLSAQERGEEPLPPIDPRRAAAYQKLRAHLASLPDSPVPASWNDDVLAAIRAGEQPRPLATSSVEAAPAPPVLADTPSSIAERRAARTPVARRGRIAAAGVLAAAAVLAIWLVARRPVAGPQGLRVSVLHYEGNRASAAAGEAALGDVLVVEVGTAEIDELRIYRDDQELVLRCPASVNSSGTTLREATCEHRSGLLIGRLRLAAPGRYRAVGLRPAPASTPSGDLAADLEACHCQSQTAPPIVTR
jgi:hypothetical protein